jgi:ABC-type dipeptide/oligopeptide/nickel transport system ATPase subunit
VTGLQVDALRVAYSGHAAVDGLSFEVSPGQSLGIAGESGSFRSTVLRALCGLAPLAAGSVRLTGGAARPVLGSAAFRRQVQMVFQDPCGSLRPRRRLAFLMVSHDLAVVTHLCDTLVVMSRGQAVERLAAADPAGSRVNADCTRQLMQAALGFSRAE